MKLRNALGVAVGTVGATAVANRLLSAGGSGFEQFLPGEERAYRWRGFDVPYVEAGDPENQDLVLLHGMNAAASNHELHRVFEDLAADYHVMAPDFPGFGHADRPPLLYSASLMTSFVTDFLREESDEPIVVASSLSGSYAAAAAGDVPVSELIMICPADETMGQRQWVRTLLRTPLLGQAMFNVLVSKRSLKRFHADHGYQDMANLSPDILDYEWATAHQPGARYAPASFVSGALDPTDSLPTVLEAVDAPITLVWGRDAEITPLSAGQALATTADARLVVFDEAKLLPHIEHPDEFVSVVRGEYRPNSPERVVAEN